MMQEDLRSLSPARCTPTAGPHPRGRVYISLAPASSPEGHVGMGPSYWNYIAHDEMTHVRSCGCVQWQAKSSRGLLAPHNEAQGPRRAPSLSNSHGSQPAQPPRAVAKSSVRPHADAAAPGRHGACLGSRWRTDQTGRRSTSRQPVTETDRPGGPRAVRVRVASEAAHDPRQLAVGLPPPWGAWIQPARRKPWRRAGVAPSPIGPSSFHATRPSPILSPRPTKQRGGSD
jgi:hypothetical protein